MRSILFDVRLAFDTPAEQDASEDILLRLLGCVARLNLQYLRKNPEVALLYDSGVKYILPDQLTAPPIDEVRLRKIVEDLKDYGVTDETIVGVIRHIKGEEIFRDIPTIYRRGGSDCNDLMGVRLAELWRVGVMASPYLEKRPNDRNGLTYHAIVQWPDGSTEDPSILLGMQADPGERDEEIRKNEERRATLLAGALALSTTGVSDAVLGAQIDAHGLCPKGGWQ